MTAASAYPERYSSDSGRIGIASPPIERINMMPTIKTFLWFLKSTLFSTRVLRPTLAIIPKRTIHIPPRTAFGIELMNPLMYPMKLIMIAKTAAISKKKQFGIDVDKKKVSLEGDIKTYGTFNAEVKFGHSVSAKIFFKISSGISCFIKT